VPGFFFLFIGTGIWTWRLVLARQVLYNLNHAPNPFLLLLFFEKSLMFLPGTGLGLQSSYLCLPVTGTTDMHHAWFICWDGVLLTFFFFFTWIGLEQPPHPISSWVAGFIGVNHHDQFLNWDLEWRLELTQWWR
jgi:hypothetical protein